MPRSERSVEGLLRLVRDQLQMDVAFLSTIRDGRRTFRSVSSAAPSPTVVPQVGDWEQSDESYCQLIIDGMVPQVVPDTTAEPLLARFPAIAEGRVGAYIGVPVRDPAGNVYGSLCAYSLRPSPTLCAADARTLSALADVLYGIVVTKDDQARARDQTADLVRTFHRGEGLALYGQPLVDLRGPNHESGMEILARFTIDGALAAPDEVFARAHDAGLGNNLEVHVLERALAIPALNQQPIAVNLSDSAIMSPQFARVISQVDPGRLCRLTIELTEHDPVDDYCALLDRLAPLRARGVKIAVDDLGAGFASMRHAVDLAADVVKIDQHLIRGLHASSRQRATVAGIMTFAERTGTRVIAEGIETRAELDAVRGLGVPWGQGYLLGRPAPIEGDAGAHGSTRAGLSTHGATAVGVA